MHSREGATVAGTFRQRPDPLRLPHRLSSGIKFLMRALRCIANMRFGDRRQKGTGHRTNSRFRDTNSQSVSINWAPSPGVMMRFSAKTRDRRGSMYKAVDVILSLVSFRDLKRYHLHATCIATERNSYLELFVLNTDRPHLMNLALKFRYPQTLCLVSPLAN